MILFRSIDHRAIGLVFTLFQFALLASAMALISSGGEGVSALYICIGAVVLQSATLGLNFVASRRLGEEVPDLTHGWLNLRKKRAASNSDSAHRIDVLHAIAMQGRRLSERVGDVGMDAIRRDSGQQAGAKRKIDETFEV